MNSKQKFSQMRKSFALFMVCTFLVVAYNNCTKGFEATGLTDAASLGGGDSGAGTDGNGGSSGGSSMPSGFSAGALKVCPSGCTFAKPSQAMAVAKDGDVIEVMSGDYKDCIDVRVNKVVVRGVGTTRPHMHSVLCGDKGTITNYGNQNRFENFEISDFGNTSQNGAGFRQDVAAKDVIITNFDFHDGQMGIMGGSEGDRIFVTDTKFHKVGILRDDGEISLPIYMTAGALLHVRKSSFLEPAGTATLIKARPLRVIIDCSTLANLQDPDNYTIDYQTGGKFEVYNSVLEQSDTTVNSTMVAVNTVSYNASIENSAVFSGNTFLNDANRGTFVKFYNTPSNPLSVENNIFVGSGTLFSNGLQPNASNKVYASRTAEMGAYPKLPAPGACKTPAPQF